MLNAQYPHGSHREINDFLPQWGEFSRQCDTIYKQDRSYNLLRDAAASLKRNAVSFLKRGAVSNFKRSAVSIFKSFAASFLSATRHATSLLKPHTPGKRCHFRVHGNVCNWWENHFGLGLKPPIRESENNPP